MIFCGVYIDINNIYNKTSFFKFWGCDMEILVALLLSCMCFIFGGTGIANHDKDSYFGSKKIESTTKNVAIGYESGKI